MFFKRKTDLPESPSAEELARQLKELGRTRDFFLNTIKSLLFFLKEFSFEISELGAESFQATLEQLYSDLSGDRSLRHKEKAFDDSKTAILEFIQKENNYFREKEAEFKKIIELLLDGMNQLIGENRDYNSIVYESSLRVEKISELNDIRKIKESLTQEVAQIKQVIRQKQTKDDRRIEVLSREVTDLRNNLEKAQKASLTDPLTGAYNRLALDTHLNRLLERFTVTGESFSLLMCDLDNFKGINDSFGHPIGDRVLKAFVLECQNYFRQDDFVGRYGGEEFAVVLPHASNRDAMKRAEALCKIVSGKQYLINSDQPDKKLTFTASIGVATLRSGDTMESLIERADKALYQAKKEGKNRARKD